MSQIHNSNTACCSIPTVVPKDKYQEKGEYKPFGEFKKAYVVGDPDSDKAIIGVYDIFGYWPQTQQGADILAESLGALVIYPDFLDGKPWDNNNFPPKTDEDKQKLQEFFGGVANVGERVKNVVALAEKLKADGAKFVGTIGFCWGGKVVTVAAGTGKTDAAVAIHPAMLDVKDANNLKVPLGIFPSKDEPLDEYEKIIKSISNKPFASKNAYKVYSNMNHGWAAARADLDDPENKEEYEDVYGTTVTFFKGVISG
ncbi:putative AIM2 family protein C30D10,14 OS=Schizosaccharomyces pombe (strain 972 / ATCC 24843) GN=SPBC30D10.14 PE=3 SV=1 [Rhizoctonia solani AG-1 IB]|uniref:Putative AIM2 family protein C30D10,14 n=1 Tax=Thanatephorus cucumeris (strain AG1-IB / isolate 7/3/14) TaxID=1108050 RepID=A0A0B7F7H0_THACB|nr:putative AIM2 family protein C30D10,14 OS=Schizosaccharomyces pombe (strain 972 / ATCC 24843) GN=SPBC30D10.14 PE=3 SV=1 [Rhizoctonia solani AG-1 IB]